MVKSLNVKDIAKVGLSIALVCLCTFVLVIPMGSFGYFNFGDLMIMLLTVSMSTTEAFITAGVGSMLADIMVGYPHYALFTLIIKGLEGFVVAKKYFKKPWMNLIVAGLVMVLGYYLVDCLIMNNKWYSFSGLFINLIQVSISILVTIFIWRWKK